MILYRKSVAYYLSGAHSQSCYYCCSSFRKCIIMQSNFVFFFSFHRGKKNIRKKERHFERSSCHFFFKESTFLERAPGGSHPSGGSHPAGRASVSKEKRKKRVNISRISEGFPRRTNAQEATRAAKFRKLAHIGQKGNATKC